MTDRWMGWAAVVVVCAGIGRAHAQTITLEEALRETSARHPSMLAAEGRLRAEEGRKLQSLAPPAPELFVHEEEIPLSGSFGDGGMRQYQISQGFDIPLLTGSRAAVQSRFVEAARARKHFTTLDVRAAVIGAYAAFYASDRRLALLRRGTELAREFAEKAQRRAEAGESTRLEAMRAAASAAAAQAAQARGEGDRAAALGRLASALGRELPATIVPGDSLTPPVLAMEEPLPGEHPLLTEARALSDGYATDAARNWMSYLPSFTLGAFKQEVAGMGKAWGAEVTASVPLWFMFDARGKGEERAGLAMEAEAGLQRSRVDIPARRIAAEAALRAAMSSMTAYSDVILREAEETLRAARLGYESGDVSYLEYIEAQRGVQDLLLGYYDALASVWNAAADYELAAGRTVIR